MASFTAGGTQPVFFVPPCYSFTLVYSDSELTQLLLIDPFPLSILSLWFISHVLFPESYFMRLLHNNLSLTLPCLA